MQILNKILLFISVLLTCSISYSQLDTSYTDAIDNWKRICKGNCISGYGEFTHYDGTIDDGFFKAAGKLDGLGTRTSKNWKYHGDFENGLMHGWGTRTYESGEIVHSYYWRNLEVTKDEWNKRESKRIEKKEEEKKERVRYKKIYNACLLDKGSDTDMNVYSLRRAVEDTCKSIAEDPSWLDNWKYN